MELVFVYYFSSLESVTVTIWEREQPRFLEEGLHSPREHQAITEHAK